MEHRYEEDLVQLEEPLREVRLGDRTVSPRSHMEHEKRIRREIANSNERRRMQSINAGFQSLRVLLPSVEGEKLSKAAILQQTAEYIYNLEQEKTRLLSQNCQLKRLLNQHEGENHPPIKKRKVDAYGDEGSGSPEPLIEGETILDGPRRDDLRMQLERERKLRLGLEDRLREFESSLFSNSDNVQYQVKHEPIPPNTEVHLDLVEAVEEMEVPLPLLSDAMEDGEIISSSALPPVVQIQTVSTTPSAKGDHDDTSGSEAAARLLRRLPSVIEAAIKAEPKVEVERLPTPGSIAALDDQPSTTTTTSRQSLETIVEAIRHLEGDHLFNDMAPPVTPPPAPCIPVQPVQEAPLALTTKNQTSTHRLIKVDMNPFLKFHTTQALQHQRPGVIVVKHT